VLFTQLSTSGMFLFAASSIKFLLDLQPEYLVGISMHKLMRKESRLDFGQAIEKAREGKIVTCKHEIQNGRGQVVQARTTLYPGVRWKDRSPRVFLLRLNWSRLPPEISPQRALLQVPPLVL
jgi:hypothetical protein